jgi:uncharacterized membrane protein YoaK (UPF0700 family)
MNYIKKILEVVLGAIGSILILPFVVLWIIAPPALAIACGLWLYHWFCQ